TCMRVCTEGLDQTQLGVKFTRRASGYSHDILNAENKKVLKKHDLSGLSEIELQVLLLQNDPFFLPDPCHFYNKKGHHCMQQNNCNKLHVCRHFLLGKCKFPQCVMSHNLLDRHASRVLEAGGIDGRMASNFQAICDYKHVEFNRQPKKVHNHRARNNGWQKPAVTRVKEMKITPETEKSTLHVRAATSIHPLSSTAPAQSQNQLPTGVGNKDEGKKDSSSVEDSKDDKKDNCDEICLFYVWKYCKNRDKCKSVHYHLPYKWEINDGLDWHDLPMMEEIEKAYCDPKNSSRHIDFQTMTCCSSLIRRLSTPSSVTKPTFLLTTEWVWYWKNNQDKWIEYGEQEDGMSTTSPSSAVVENLYQADPCAVVRFQTDQHNYELNLKEMTQTNITFKTRRQICRRPKFVSSEDVQRIKTSSQRDSSIPSKTCPSHWDASALPDIGYKAVVISNMTCEYNGIKQLFHQTMKNYRILKIERIQNPSLWKVFQWQKEKMKRENGGKEVQEKQLFHGTDIFSMKTICTQNFDWRICGSHGTNYGKGIYFARDACYAHSYSQPAPQGRLMFVARVLVGDYVKGNAAYVRPPAKSANKLCLYDSCVDDEFNPSVFVVFEKHQIYPEYIIQYEKERIREQKEAGIRAYGEQGIGAYGDEATIRMQKDDRKKCVIS
uniref:PAR12 polymerase n=1 Tax=Zosterops lateralis melanops TaxID=1220523 RepID=A0A8D2PQP4_ZOSLA